MVNSIQTQHPLLIQDSVKEVNFDAWNSICPDLTPYWKLLKVKGKEQIFLKAEERIHRFSECEGYALMHFTGQLTADQVQQRCQQKFSSALSPEFILELFQKLIDLEILSSAIETPQPYSPRLKSSVHWIHHPDGYWLLRNPEDMTFLQVNDESRAVIGQLGEKPVKTILESANFAPENFQYLLKLLTATAMLEGSKLPQPPKRKFTPLQLLFFKVRLFNPDSFLSQLCPFLEWIWTKVFGFLLLGFISYSAAIAFYHQAEILQTGQQLWQYQGASLIIPFALLTGLVVTLHELGHALTLKHYGGIVPEIGFLFMFLMPAAYTNTTDSYCLSRWKRILVVAAGVLVQFAIAACAFWLWNFTAVGNWLHTASYLLMLAALVTIALNLNPLAKFDGYYLAVAVTGINNLRTRSFQFYQNLFSFKPIFETALDKLILAIYAPFSFIYIQFIFGYLLYTVLDWVIIHIPMTALALLSIWAIYYFSPSFSTQK